MYVAQKRQSGQSLLNLKINVYLLDLLVNKNKGYVT